MNNEEEDLKLREDHYNIKIQLMERDVIAEEKIVTALKEFCAPSRYDNIELLRESLG